MAKQFSPGSYKAPKMTNKTPLQVAKAAVAKGKVSEVLEADPYIKNIVSDAFNITDGRDFYDKFYKFKDQVIEKLFGNFNIERVKDIYTQSQIDSLKDPEKFNKFFKSNLKPNQIENVFQQYLTSDILKTNVMRAYMEDGRFLLDGKRYDFDSIDRFNNDSMMIFKTLIPTFIKEWVKKHGELSYEVIYDHWSNGKPLLSVVSGEKTYGTTSVVSSSFSEFYDQPYKVTIKGKSITYVNRVTYNNFSGGWD